MIVFAALQRWWRPRRLPPEPTVPYEGSCSCGHALTGRRQRSAQMIVCPGCGRKRLLFPRSPWSEPGTSGPSSRAAAAIPSSSVNLRRLVLVILVGGAAAMAAIFLVIRLHLRRAPGSVAETATLDARALTEAAQRELREGNVHLALKELNAAIEQRARSTDSLSREEVRHLMQLRRQSDLLAHLLDDPLEEVLQQALQVRNEEEWRAKFEDYRGRGVLFEDVIRRDAAGRPALGNYLLRSGDVEARIALEDLALLQHLPLDPPQHWLFGARLASCRREKGGEWTIRFEPDSTVLLTDEAAAAAGWPGPLDDDLRTLLRRQAECLPR